MGGNVFFLVTLLSLICRQLIALNIKSHCPSSQKAFPGFLVFGQLYNVSYKLNNCQSVFRFHCTTLGRIKKKLKSTVDNVEYLRNTSAESRENTIYIQDNSIPLLESAPSLGINILNFVSYLSQGAISAHWEVLRKHQLSKRFS